MTPTYEQDLFLTGTNPLQREAAQEVARWVRFGETDRIENLLGRGRGPNMSRLSLAFFDNMAQAFFDNSKIFSWRADDKNICDMTRRLLVCLMEGDPRALKKASTKLLCFWNSHLPITHLFHTGV